MKTKKCFGAKGQIGKKFMKSENIFGNMGQI